MRKGYKDITILLDRSGSMSNMAADVIGGFNKFIEDQAALPGGCTLTLIQFDSGDVFDVVVAGRPIAQVPLLTKATFVPRGNTPLYDALYRAIEATGSRLAALPEQARPEKVVFVIITDGEENASRVHDQRACYEAIQHQTTVYQWEFVYLGANQDAFKVGAGIGIPRGTTMTYLPHGKQMLTNWGTLSANLRDVRTGTKISMNFTDEQRAKALDKNTK